MKKIAVGIAVVFGFTLLQPVQAQAANESIVIIDTAIDSTRPEFKNKLIYEVCITPGYKCPNGSFFQEGKGAATLPVTQAYSKGFEHGTIMSLVANQVNPDVNLIFIRIAGMLKTGSMASYSDVQLNQALAWVVANKTKFNIVSVSASMGHHSLNKTGSYCPIKATHNGLIANINKLISVGVPTILATGNGYDLNRVDFPACIPAAVAVSGIDYNTDDGFYIGPWANGGPDVDFYALGVFKTQLGLSRGTSASAAAFSAYWAKNYRGTYQSTYDYLNSITKSAKNTKSTTTLFVDILK